MCGPNLIDTTASLALQDVALHELYNMKSAQIASGFNYDCAVFDKNNSCFTVAGRMTDVGSDAARTFDGALIGGYRVSDQLRIGGYVDMGIPGHAGTGIRVDNDVPMLGLSGDWGQHPDGSGFSAHFAGGYQTTTLGIQRQVITHPIFGIPIPGSEPGYGESTLQARGATAVFSYGVPVDQWFAAPYAGLQETVITRGGYTETANANVLDPVTYKSLTDRQTTLVTGLRLSHHLSPRTTLHLAGGLEHDINHGIGTNAGTSGLGTSTAAFGGTYRQTRGLASAGVGYDIAPLHSVNVTVDYRQEALGAAGSITSIVAYQVGF